MNIELTNNATKHIQAMLEQRGHGIGLRLGTRKNGCSGFAYVVEYADSASEGDELVERSGIKLLVDRESVAHLDGMTIDFVRNNILNSGFEFINPNATTTCGCGESVGF